MNIVAIVVVSLLGLVVLIVHWSVYTLKESREAQEELKNLKESHKTLTEVAATRKRDLDSFRDEAFDLKEKLRAIEEKQSNKIVTYKVYTGVLGECIDSHTIQADDYEDYLADDNTRILQFGIGDRTVAEFYGGVIRVEEVLNGE